MTFKTANLYEISLLLSLQKPFIKIDRDNPEKVIFHFDNIKECENILSSFYSKEKLVSPFEFMNALKTAKQIIYNYAKK